MERELLQQEFDNKYGNLKIGALGEDVRKYPDTKLHRKLYPELYNFNFFGFDCIVKRNYSGNWCGYIKIYETIFNKFDFMSGEGEKSIREYEKNKEIDEFLVHGGITYQNIENSKLNENNKIFKIGFDTCHWGDLNWNDMTSNNEYTYKDHAYVVKELKFLALQLFLSLPKWSFETHKEFPKHYQERFWNICKQWKFMKPFLLEKSLWVQIISELFEAEKQDAYISNYLLI